MNLILTVNGRTHHLEAVPEEASLLEVLREHLHVTSPKDGCSPQGQCGCCTVLVDGHARTACASPAKTCDGKGFLTLEGANDTRGGDVQRHRVRHQDLWHRLRPDGGAPLPGRRALRVTRGPGSVAGPADRGPR